MNNKSNVQELTTYQLSQNLGANYKAVRAIVDNFAAKGIVKIVGQSASSHQASIYAFDNAVIQTIESLLKERGKKIESGASVNILRTLEELQHLQRKVQESTEKIRLQEELINRREQEIQELKSSNVQLDANLKITKSELKLIEDKSRTMEGAYAEQKQRAEALERTVKSRTISLLVAIALLLSISITIICYFIFRSI